MSEHITELLGDFRKIKLDATSSDDIFVGPLKSVYFSHGNSLVRGLAADKLIEKGNVLLQMPRKFVWSPEEAQGSRFFNIGPHTKLAFLLAEASKAKTKANTIASYIGSMPSLDDYREQGLPFTAPDEDLNILAKLPHLRDIAQHVREARTVLQENLADYNAHLDSVSASPITWDEILWAGSAVMTRAFWCKGNYSYPIMVPIADLLNHSDHPNVAWHCKDGNMVLKALNDIKLGDELTESYNGQHEYNSTNMFAKWGIVIGDMEPWDAGDCETIRSAHLEHSDSLVLRKAHKLASLHCPWSADREPNVFHDVPTVSKVACVSGFLPSPRIYMRDMRNNSARDNQVRDFL